MKREWAPRPPNTREDARVAARDARRRAYLLVAITIIAKSWRVSEAWVFDAVAEILDGKSGFRTYERRGQPRRLTGDNLRRRCVAMRGTCVLRDLAAWIDPELDAETAKDRAFAMICDLRDTKFIPPLLSDRHVTGVK